MMMAQKTKNNKKLTRDEKFMQKKAETNKAFSEQLEHYNKAYGKYSDSKEATNEPTMELVWHNAPF